MFVVEYVDDFYMRHITTVDTVNELHFLFERFDAQVYFRDSNCSVEQASSEFRDAKQSFSEKHRLKMMDKCRC